MNPPEQVSNAVEHLFRHESGRMVSILTGIFGLDHLTLVEDVVQEALVRALQTWPFYGMPENPSAWIMRTARNLALDVVRREQVFRGKEPEIIRLMEDEPAPTADHEIADDRLRMMFVCCHPVIPPEAQVALALKTLGGFSPLEIARAFLTSEAAIAKRLTRAKQKIRDERIPFEIPAGAELARRMDGVQQALYLLFNEGYKASTGDSLVRADVCEEAIRLAGLLAAHPAGNTPRTHALLAQMLLSAARLPSRVDSDGNLLRLQEQDRGKWDRALIARGMFHLAHSAGGESLTEYHLQAAIAACHCAARDFAATDWKHILALYDRLMTLDGSPIVALNRAVALAQVHGPQAGLDALAAVREPLDAYYLLHAALGDFEDRLGRGESAAAHFARAIELAELASEKAYLARRLENCPKKVS